MISLSKSLKSISVQAFILGGCLAQTLHGQGVGDLSNLTGIEMVKEMRSIRPMENTEIKAVIKYRDQDRSWFEHSIKIRTEVDRESWETTYTLLRPNDSLPLAYRISWKEGAMPSYSEIRRKEGEVEEKSVSGRTALFGSDFYLSDIGFEFLYWPYHRALSGPIAMKRGRPAREIESTNPNPNGVYAKLRYWVDRENFGILQAEAFDAQGASIRSFEPDSIVKVDGRWHIRELQMRDKVDRTRSSIVFEYESEE